jgi:hypothetical protein
MSNSRIKGAIRLPATLKLEINTVCWEVKAMPLGTIVPSVNGSFG